MKLEDLVPPLELCKKIPAGEFNYTAFTWYAVLQHINKNPPHEYSYYVADSKKDNLAWGGYKANPAPTLQEILEELPKDDAENDLTMNHSLHEKFGGYHIFYRGSLKLHCFDKNAVVAAMKLWLKMKGIEA